MLTPEEIDALAERIVSGHQEAMVSALTDQLVTALVSDGTLTVKDRQLLEKVAGLNRDAVYGVLGEYRSRIDAETRSLALDALKASDAADVEVLTALYGGAASAGGTAAFNRMAQETAQGLALIIGRDNLQMAEHAATVWYDVSAEAIARWNHGGDTVDHIIADAIGRLTREGISVIDYKSGVRSSTDVAVRRHVVTQISQATGRMTMNRMTECGHDLVVTTAHFGSRPEHATWQGKVFSLSGTHPRYPDFYAVTGYGTVTGLAGANCRHGVGPFYEGMEEPPEPMPETNDTGMTNDEYYEATQKQRRRERAIRQTKADIHGLEVGGVEPDSDAMVAARLKLGKQQRDLKAFTDSTGLPRIPKREKAYGIGAQPRGLRVDPRPKMIALPGGMTMSTHALEQSIARGVSKVDIYDTIKQPLHRTSVRLDQRGRPSYQIIGQRATIAVNPDTGVVPSTWKTGRGRLKKYGDGSP